LQWRDPFGDSLAATSPFKSKGGRLASGTTCEQWWLLREVCFVVDPATRGIDLSSSYGKGCTALDSNFPSSQASAVLADASASVGPYRHVSLSSPPATADFTSVTFTVRASTDPWVTALRITQGNPASFGLTVGQLVGAGIACIVIGMCIIGLLVGVVVCVSHMCRKRGATTTTGGTVIGVTGAPYAPQPFAGSSPMGMPAPAPMALPVAQPVGVVSQPQYGGYPSGQSYPSAPPSYGSPAGPYPGGAPPGAYGYPPAATAPPGYPAAGGGGYPPAGGGGYPPAGGGGYPPAGGGGYPPAGGGYRGY